MTARRSTVRPTQAELEILRVLWKQGPSTVREVHSALDAPRQVGYTTVLKLLQIMSGKGLVARDERERTHVYRAAQPPERTRRQLVSDLVERAFEGSATSLVLHALSGRKASPEELAEIRELLDRLEEGPR
jgi:BlaI family transcriptional regulator, penicillinase repressor